MRRDPPAPIDFRLYRFAWAPALLAFVILMFSFVGAPDGLEPATPPTVFDDENTARDARRIAEIAPERTPGSEGDERIAELVVERFRESTAGIVSEQTIETEFDGEAVTARNVWLTLPGESTETVVVTAARDAAAGPGAASSAASTAILLELAAALGVSGHDKTFVLASTSGDAEGAQGTQALLEELEVAEVAAVIVVSQPGALEPRAPFVVETSTGTATGSAQLERTLELAVEAQVGHAPYEAGGFAQLARLALPSGLGAQAPLIADGIDAARLSSAGEGRLAEGDDAPEKVSSEDIAAFGRATLGAVNAIDVASAEPVHGPSTYVELDDNLIPGWTLSLLALTLLLPAVVAAVDGCARSARRHQPLVAGLAWAATRALPFVGALATLYGLALVGLIPSPAFPFDPALYPPGVVGVGSLVVIAVVAVGSAWLLTRGRAGGRGDEAAIAALGALSALASLLLWLANPYLALLAAPLAHVWLLTTGRGVARAILVAVACLLACVPVLAAALSVAGALDLGAMAPWTFTLMIADGQIGLWTTLAGALIAGAAAGAVGMAMSRRGAGPQAAP